MSKHLKNIIDGMWQSLTLWSGSSYVVPKRGDTRMDADALAADFGLVASQLRKTIKKERHGAAHTSQR